MTSKLIQSTAPVLPSLNLTESLQFYTTVLGFREALSMDGYVIVERDGAEIHFWPCQERHLCENSSCYIRTPNTAALHEEFIGKGLRIDPPVTRAWGMKELYVIDPHGNLLKFGEPA